MLVVLAYWAQTQPVSKNESDLILESLTMPSTSSISNERGPGPNLHRSAVSVNVSHLFKHSNTELSGLFFQQLKLRPVQGLLSSSSAWFCNLFKPLEEHRGGRFFPRDLARPCHGIGFLGGFHLNRSGVGSKQNTHGGKQDADGNSLRDAPTGKRVRGCHSFFHLVLLEFQAGDLDQGAIERVDRLSKRGGNNSLEAVFVFRHGVARIFRAPLGEEPLRFHRETKFRLQRGHTEQNTERRGWIVAPIWRKAGFNGDLGFADGKKVHERVQERRSHHHASEKIGKNLALPSLPGRPDRSVPFCHLVVESEIILDGMRCLVRQYQYVRQVTNLEPGDADDRDWKLTKIILQLPVVWDGLADDLFGLKHLVTGEGKGA